MLMSSLPMYLVAFPAVAGLPSLCWLCAPEGSRDSEIRVLLLSLQESGWQGNILGRLVGGFTAIRP